MLNETCMCRCFIDYWIEKCTVKHWKIYSSVQHTVNYVQSSSTIGPLDSQFQSNNLLLHCPWKYARFVPNQLLLSRKLFATCHSTLFLYILATTFANLACEDFDFDTVKVTCIRVQSRRYFWSYKVSCTECVLKT